MGELSELWRGRLDRRLAPSSGEPPVHFIDGVLWMRAGLRVTRIEAWPSLRAWSRPRPGAPERQHRPRIDFLAVHRLASGPAAPMESSLWAWARLVRSIPEAIRERVAGYRSGHWRLLQLVGHVPRALDLFDNPALAFLVAHASRFRPAVGIDLSTLVGSRRRAIVGEFGYPAVEAMVRLLGRWPRTAISVSRLLGLREALRDDPEWLRSLPHLVRAGTEGLDMVSDRRLRPALTRRLVQAIVRVDDPETAAAYVRLARDTVAMAETAAVPQVEAPQVPRPRGLGALRRAHDSLTERLNRDARTRPSEALPPPPVPGTEMIQPLTSTGDLFAEGDRQHNCVGSYAVRVRTGTFYVYRMLRPERATLAIVRIGGAWLVDDLRTKRNRQASPVAWHAAQEWLAGKASPRSTLPANHGGPLFERLTAFDAEEGRAPAGEVPDPPAVVAQVPPPTDVSSPGCSVPAEPVHGCDQAIVEAGASDVAGASILGRGQAPSGPRMRVRDRSGEDISHQVGEPGVVPARQDGVVDHPRFFGPEHHRGVNLSDAKDFHQ